MKLLTRLHALLHALLPVLLQTLLLLCSLVACLDARASPGNEIVLVLDNSASMAVSVDTPFGRMPANDPDRAAVLGALVVEGLARGSSDRVTVLAFGTSADSPPRVVEGADALRALPYSRGTWYAPPLREAARRLGETDRTRRLLLFFTDGLPEDLTDPTEGRALLGLDREPGFESLVISLGGSELARRGGEYFLRPLVRSPDRLVFLDGPQRVVSAFTEAFARAVGSRAISGRLSPGDARRFEVPSVVDELQVMVASTVAGPALRARLEGPGGLVLAQASGDNGCPAEVKLRQAPHICDEPRRRFEVFRTTLEPGRAGVWTLGIEEAPGEVEYGIILRHALSASLLVAPRARLGERLPIEASLLLGGRPFTGDEAFFTADGFEAALGVHVGGEKAQIPLRHLGGGRFEGIWEPRTPSAGAPAELTVHFRNDWMDVEARRSVVIDDYLDLALAASPNPLELGVWRGERGPSRRCADLDLSGSTNADRIPIKCVIEGLPRGFEGSCLPLPDVGGDSAEPLAWRVCVRTPRCCGEADGSATFARLSGQDARYAATSLAVPVRFRVEETGFLRCWWPVLALAAALLVVLFVLWGFLSPHGFDPAFTVRVAGSEAGLRRTSALVLREMPGGSRGFYRNAHTCLNADGDFLRSPRRAVLVLEAGPGGSTRFVRAAGMERRNRRNNLWEPLPVEDLHMGFAAGVIYRIGGLFLKFE